MFKISNFGKALIIAILAIFVAGTTGSALAAKSQTAHRHSHHRHQVRSHQHHKQTKHIKRKVHQGKIKKSKTANLHQEERAMTALNGGDTTTKSEPKAIDPPLENLGSAQIGK